MKVFFVFFKNYSYYHSSYLLLYVYLCSNLYDDYEFEEEGREEIGTINDLREFGPGELNLNGTTTDILMRRTANLRRMA